MLKTVFTILAMLGATYHSSASAESLLVSGADRGDAILLDSANDWTILNSAPIAVQFATDPRIYGCVATASADVKNPGPALRENQYRFVLTLDFPFATVDGAGERTLELVDNPVVATSNFNSNYVDMDDPASESIMLTDFFGGLTATNGIINGRLHFIYLLGRKVQESDSNAQVLDSSLSVVCLPPTDWPTDRPTDSTMWAEFPLGSTLD